MTSLRILSLVGIALLALGCQRASTGVMENTAMAAEHPSDSKKPDASATKSSAKTETATFGEGCFWCSEAVFQRLRGVKSVVSGYSGGNVEKPTYEQVSSGNTGHA